MIFINNANYGMTGGQMAPTTLVGQKTATTPLGRKSEDAGYPLRMTEFLAPLQGVKYAARGALHSPKLVRLAKAYIKRAFEVQESKTGFSFVELLSICPTNWSLSPLEAVKKLEELMLPVYPLGVVKDDAQQSIRD